MNTINLTHSYAFQLMRAARSMPVDLAENQPQIRALRTIIQKKALKGRTNQLTS